MKNEYNPNGKDIRFIDSRYNDLFWLPDGGYIQIDYPDETVNKRCIFLDEHHTQVGSSVYHICQFAEVMERIGAVYQVEPEITAEEAAWKVGQDRILALQACEDGYDYTLFDQNYHDVDGGQLDAPDLTMSEARTEILASFHLAHRELRAMVYEDVMEQADQVASRSFPSTEKKSSVVEKLAQATERAAPTKALRPHKEPER